MLNTINIDAVDTHTIPREGQMSGIMEISNELQQLKEEALKKVREAAESGNVRMVNHYARIAEDCEKALEKLEELLHTVHTLRRRITLFQEEPEGFEISSPELNFRMRRARISSVPPYKPSPRERGAEARRHWLSQLEVEAGINLTGSGGSTYTAPGGALVGVAYGVELAGKPDSWFLSLPNKSYDVVVLLCETRDGQLFDFVIPIDELRDAWEATSVGTGGRQRKINVKKDNGDFALLVPGGEKVSIGRFLKNYEPLGG